MSHDPTQQPSSSSLLNEVEDLEAKHMALEQECLELLYEARERAKDKPQHLDWFPSHVARALEAALGPVAIQRFEDAWAREQRHLVAVKP